MDKAEKLALLFNAHDLEVMHAVRRVFDPRGLMNPGKVFPTGQHACVPAGPASPQPVPAGLWV
jgi:hypothetical protein